ncbi:MAG: hypothetical protein DRI69_07315 [Bacteroidetes bacterium]|nr:MAG: hypothetical protein DRI69_07315 [Bacteroidota bacterium]
MIVREVNTPDLEKLFLQVHVDCNRDDPRFIRPLDQDILAVFDPGKNKTFRFGEVKRWILFDEAEAAVGRIAAFTNRKYKNKGDTVRVGGIGFFDCRNDTRYADRLFQTAQDWLAEQGMEAMDGPINFGERDMWWGLLVEGFDSAVYGMNYNPPYYQKLFEDFGFRVFYNQICWALPMANEKAQLQKKFYDQHDKFAADPDFQARHIKKQEEAKFAHDFCAVYNKAWAKHGGNKNIEEKQALKIYHAMRPVMDENLVWFVYHRSVPIAMWISMPDINQVIRHLDGKLDLWGKLKFAYYRWRGEINRMVGFVFGVVPEFQGTGVDYFMIVEAERGIKVKGRYTDVELQWQGDFNPKIINISLNLGAIQKRRLVTYRYLFDENMIFQRHPTIV